MNGSPQQQAVCPNNWRFAPTNSPDTPRANVGAHSHAPLQWTVQHNNGRFVPNNRRFSPTNSPDTPRANVGAHSRAPLQCMVRPNNGRFAPTTDGSPQQQAVCPNNGRFVPTNSPDTPLAEGNSPFVKGCTPQANVGAHGRAPLQWMVCLYNGPFDPTTGGLHQRSLKLF